ncbi:MAG: hypothetical protein R6W72_13405 [Desulfurivibrionaceae bacterium]
MKISRIFKRCCLIMLATLLVGSLAHAQEETKPRLAVLPFTLNAPDDSDYLKEGVRTMLASRIAARAGVVVIGGGEAADLVGDRDERDPEALAEKLAADLVLTGSITVLGPSVSIDARLYMVEKNISESFFAAAENQARLIGAVDLIATEVSSVMLGEERRPFKEEEAPAEVPPASTESAPAPEDQSLHPDRIFQEPVVVPPPPEAPAEVPAVAPPMPTAPVSGPENGQVLSPDPDLSATRSQFLDLEIQVIDAGDLFGEGGEQIVVAEKQKITVFRRDNGQLRKVAEIPKAPRHVRIIALNLADLNNNGRAEIYVSAVSGNTPYSYAAEWDGRQFTKLFDRQPHYLRPIFVPGRGWGLYGQQADFEGPVRPGIYKADPATGSLDLDDRFAIPDSANLYEFVPGDFTGDGRLEIAVQTRDGKLLVYNGEGEVLWRGSNEYGYTRRFLGEPYSGSGNHENMQVPTRLVAEDLNGNGRQELVAMENPSGVAALLKTVGSFVGGSVKVLTWNGVTFTELWSSGEIGGYVASFQVEGARLHLGLVTEKSGGLFAGLQSYVASYGLAGF